MSRDQDRTPDRWEFDSSEQPVPLTGPPAQAGRSQQETFAVADEAESIVRSARDELAGEDADLLIWPPDDPALTGVGRGLQASSGLSPRPGFAVALLVACVGMFGLGWGNGTVAREPSGDVRIEKDVSGVTSRVLGAISTSRERSSSKRQRHTSAKKEVQK